MTNRKLAAVFAADIAGYSALMSANEEETVRRLKAVQAAVLPILEAHGGRVIDLAGDGILAEFGSAVRAVESAIAAQRCMGALNGPSEPRMQFRIGINIGDVIHDDQRLYGDGINIAARLETIAEPGGICISQKVHEEVFGKIDCAFRDIGDQHLKNISKPVRAFSLSPGLIASGADAAIRDAPLSVSDKPSIVVLPFQNMSGDPEQEYFADGMVEEITTALSRFRQLFVIARNSSFTYKGRAIDVKQVGRELGVRYALEGSVRKSGSRVRITGQLIDATSGMHLWADRFDGSIDDVFDLQDQVTASVVAAIAPRLEQTEIERAKRKPTENLDAYDHYLRGVASAIAYTREGDNEALRLFYRAIEIDPNFAVAYGSAAWIFVNRKTNGWMTDRPREIAEAVRLARRAVELGGDDAAALAWGGFALAYVGYELDDGIAFLDRALALNANLAAAWYVSGWLSVYSGATEEAVERFARAMRLSPVDPLIFRMHAGTAYAHFFAGRYEEASAWAEKAVRARPTWLTAVRGAAATHALAGRLDEARKLMARMRELDPALRISNLKELLPLRREEDFARWADALRIAGLPA
jgi:adenylate cyclase